MENETINLETENASWLATLVETYIKKGKSVPDSIMESSFKGPNKDYYKSCISTLQQKHAENISALDEFRKANGIKKHLLLSKPEKEKMAELDQSFETLYEKVARFPIAAFQLYVQEYQSQGSIRMNPRTYEVFDAFVSLKEQGISILADKELEDRLYSNYKNFTQTKNETPASKPSPTPAPQNTEQPSSNAGGILNIPTETIVAIKKSYRELVGPETKALLDKLHDFYLSARKDLSLMLRPYNTQTIENIKTCAELFIKKLQQIKEEKPFINIDHYFDWMQSVIEMCDKKLPASEAKTEQQKKPEEPSTTENNQTAKSSNQFGE